MWIFSAVLFFVGYLMQEGLGVTLFVGATGDYLESLTTSSRAAGEVDVSPVMLFGNWIAGVINLGQLLLNGATGGIVTDAFSALPIPFKEPVMLLIRFLYSISGAFLILSVATGRDL